MEKVIIVIPIYKSELSWVEKASLHQCIKILGQFPIKFVCPKNLEVTHYEEMLQDKTCNFSFEKFDNKYFKSVADYSKLLLDKIFYQRFADYEFMLIYQLDAWVFENKLEYWCDKNYDYIGAPWFEGLDEANGNSPMMPVAGNGGFSLRKIPSVLKVLSINYKEPQSFSQIYNKNKKKNKFIKLLCYPLYLIKYLFQPQHFSPVWKTTKMYEDYSISIYGPMVYDDFKTAPPEIALQFSFEAQPKRLYELNNKTLPFGCHAFEKYDYEFWKSFIQI